MEDEPVATAFDVDDGWLCSLDGAQYFRSTTIRCLRCTATQRDETRRYAHTALIPVLVNRDRKEVLALEPEFVVPQDGTEK